MPHLGGSDCGMTVTVQLAERLLADFTVITAVPVLTAVRSPFDTLTTLLLLDVHVTEGFASCEEDVPKG